MTEYEKIKNMSIEEMTTFIVLLTEQCECKKSRVEGHDNFRHQYCEGCPIFEQTKGCGEKRIKQFLNSNVK